MKEGEWRIGGRRKRGRKRPCIEGKEKTKKNRREGKKEWRKVRNESDREEEEGKRCKEEGNKDCK